MTRGWWNDDDELLDLVRDALSEQRAVPERFLTAGKAAFAWHSIDAELAALAYDSITEPLATAAATRTEHAAIRELTFAFRNATVHMQVAHDALQGQVVPPQPGEMEVHVEGQSTQRTTIDDQGWFSYAPLPTAPFRLLWRVTVSGPAMTEWLSL
jgi:hypothetical protein